MSLPIKPIRVHRTLRVALKADVSLLRTASFNGAEHLIVPVVAMVGNSIIRPLNSTGPEFVPAAELEYSVPVWNNRPVMPDHPRNGTSTANTPEILQAEQFGVVFNTRFENENLVMDAWLNLARAESLGGVPQSVVTRCKAGEVVEISVGAYADLEEKSGTYEGQAYEFIWHNVGSDHLAMLPTDVIGACSITMGCGAPRNAILQMEDITLMAAANQNVNVNPTKPNLAKRLRSMFRAANEGPIVAQDTEDGVSDVDLRDKLWAALWAVEPGFGGIEGVWPETSTVVYTVYPEGTRILYERTFTVAADETIALNDDRKEVQATITYKPVAAIAGGTDPACSCHANKNATTVINGGNTIMANVTQVVKDLVGKLITSKKFKEGERAALEALSEGALKTLDEQVKPEEVAAPVAAPVITPVVTPVETTPVVSATPITTVTAPATTSAATPASQPATSTVSIDAAEYQTLREIAAQHRAIELARKATLVMSLKAAQSRLTEAQLNAMPLAQLEDLAGVVNSVSAGKIPNAPASSVGHIDYSNRPVAINSSEDTVPAPPDLAAKLRERRAARSAAN